MSFIAFPFGEGVTIIYWLEKSILCVKYLGII